MPTHPSAPIAATRVTARDDTTRELVMLHGIFGRGRNWHTIARALVVARPEYACWLVDLPHHGASGPGAHGDTVEGLAQDLDDWLESRGCTAILGHSYGGKVALAYAARHRSRPVQVWVIDSTPETKPPSGSAWGMLRLVRSLPDPFASRSEAVGAIVAAGYQASVAKWMATNLVHKGDRFGWRLDFDAMERLMRDFFQSDAWAVVDAPAPHDLHFLKSSESSAMSPAAMARIAEAGPHVHLHERAGGHWIHTESPAVVTELIARWLP